MAVSSQEREEEREREKADDKVQCKFLVHSQARDSFVEDRRDGALYAN